MKKLSIFAAAIVCAAQALAQSPVDYVTKYNKLINGYLKEGDVEMREEIDNMLRGGRNKCYISNRIGQDMAQERNIDVELMHSDTYHNQLMNWHKKGVVKDYVLSDIVWQSDWVEPRIKMSNDKAPVQFVSANVHTEGSKTYNTADLFYIQDGHIVNIVDLGNEGLGNAIRLYSMKRYDEAFSIFRKIALTNRNALKARYYTAVMLITGKGCKHIDRKVRDQEAAWLGLSGYFSGDDDLSSLAYKFSMTLPFPEALLIHYPAAYNGRRVIKKGDKYGIIDDSGRMVLDYRKGNAGPLSCDGYALITAPTSDKNGLMDSEGNQVLPFNYDRMLPYFHNDHIYVIKGTSLQLLSRAGNVIKNIDGQFTNLAFATIDGHILAYNGKGYQLYDYNGNLVYDTADFDKWSLHKDSGLVELKKDDKIIWHSYEKW